LADSIDTETSELKELITNQDFTRLEGRLKRFGAKATDGGTEALPRKSVTVHVAAAEAKAAQAVAAHDAAAVTSGNHALQAASGTEVARCGTGHVSSLQMQPPLQLVQLTARCLGPPQRQRLLCPTSARSRWADPPTPFLWKLQAHAGHIKTT
jgi:hypothetical protein